MHPASSSFKQGFFSPIQQSISKYFLHVSSFYLIEGRIVSINATDV